MPKDPAAAPKKPKLVKIFEGPSHGKKIHVVDPNWQETDGYDQLRRKSGSGS